MNVFIIEMYCSSSSQWRMQRFDNNGEKNTISNWYVNAMDIDRPYSQNKRAVNDGVSRVNYVMSVLGLIGYKRVEVSSNQDIEFITALEGYSRSGPINI